MMAVRFGEIAQMHGYGNYDEGYYCYGCVEQYDDYYNDDYAVVKLILHVQDLHIPETRHCL